MPAALKVFNAKITTQLLYGAPLWIEAFDHSIERIQSKFLRKILGMPVFPTQPYVWNLARDYSKRKHG